MLSSPRRFSNLILDINPDELGNAIRLGIGVLNSVPAERPLQQERSCCLSAACLRAAPGSGEGLARSSRAKRRAEHPCLRTRAPAFQPENAEWWGGQATIVPNSTTGESVILGVRLGSDSRIAVRLRVPRFVAC